jgi:hypothetical protein
MNQGPTPLTDTADARRKEWLERLQDLLNALQQWGQELGWETRFIEKRMTDSELGAYTAPGLLMQRETVKILAEPIARMAPGASGVVDLYLLPGYDDIASLYHTQSGWQLHYAFPDTSAAAAIREAEALPLDQASFVQVLEAMTRNAV